MTTRTAAVAAGTAALALFAGQAAAERIELRSGAMVISAPAEVDCAAPPDFTLENAGARLFATDRSDLNDLVSKMAQGLAGSCDGLESLTVRGEENGIAFSFEVTAENDWRLDRALEETQPESQPEDEPVPAAAVTEAPTETAATPAAAEEEPPARPRVEPGLDFATFASIFGTVPAVRGHVSFDNTELWSRVLAARMYAERPEILNDDTNAIDLLAQMATQPEYLQVLGPVAAKQPQQMSVFERRDVAERIRTQLRGGLDQRRQTGPIPVYNAVQVRLPDYDFNTQSFPLTNLQNLRNHREARWKNIYVHSAFSNLVLPTRLPATVDQARELDAYLRSRNDLTLYIAVFGEIDPVMPTVLGDRVTRTGTPTNTTITQVAIFADRGLTQMLYDFTADLAAAQAEADAAAAALNEPVSTMEDLVRAIDGINQTALASSNFAEAMSVHDWNGTGETQETRRAQIEASIAAASSDRTLRFRGSLMTGTYDAVRGVLPLQWFNVERPGFASGRGNANITMAFIPEVSGLPVDETTAARIVAASRSNQIEFRLDAEMIQGGHQVSSPGYFQVNTTLRPRSIELFGGNPNNYQEPRSIVLDLDFPEVASTAPSLIAPLTPLAPPQ